MDRIASPHMMYRKRRRRSSSLLSLTTAAVLFCSISMCDAFSAPQALRSTTFATTTRDSLIASTTVSSTTISSTTTALDMTPRKKNTEMKSAAVDTATSSTTSSQRSVKKQQQRTAASYTGRGSAASQFTPAYLAYEEDKLMGKVVRNRHMINSQNGEATDSPVRQANPDTLPTLSERYSLTEKIARLLRDDDDDVDTTARRGTTASSRDQNPPQSLSQLNAMMVDAYEIADKQTVFRKLSDEDLREASDAVAKSSGSTTVKRKNRRSKDTSLSSSLDVAANTSLDENKPKKSGKVTANVMETGRDSIAQYMKSLGNHLVLSPEDEVVLGRQIQILSQWEEKRQELELSLSRPPTFAEWANLVDTTIPELKHQVRRSQKAKAALVEANLRLVVTVARQTVKRNRSEISFQDACQEGILGLHRACEKFDPEKGFRFSTYAVWWIRKLIHKNVSEQSRPVRLPANVMRKINEIRIQEKILQDAKGRRPRDEEVAAKVGITVEKLEFYRRSLQQVTSLDSKVKFNKNGGADAHSAPEVHEIVQDSQAHSPVQAATNEMLKHDVSRLIKTLSPREQAVIRLRFGLDNGTPATLDDIARKFKCDLEMIRKIEARALRKLRQPYRNESLKSYMSDL